MERNQRLKNKRKRFVKWFFSHNKQMNGKQIVFELSNNALFVDRATIYRDKSSH